MSRAYKQIAPASMRERIHKPETVSTLCPLSVPGWVAYLALAAIRQVRRPDKIFSMFGRCLIHDSLKPLLRLGVQLHRTAGNMLTLSKAYYTVMSGTGQKTPFNKWHDNSAMSFLL